MRFACVSDTHNKRVPRFNADVLLHAGDLTVRGTESEWRDAIQYLAGYPARRIIITPGNHDIICERQPELARRICEDSMVKLLINESTEAGGLKIFGSPFVQDCWGAFQYDNFERLNPWDKIPVDTDILLTHSPAKFILDKGPRGDNLGCQYLKERIYKIKPKFHVHGHIHCAYGQETNNGIITINASICSERYDSLNPPIIFHSGVAGDYERW